MNGRQTDWRGVWVGLAAILFILLSGGAVFAGDVPWGMPENYSSTGGELDFYYMIIFWVTAPILVVTEAILVYFVIKYRFKEGRKSYYQHGHHKLEIAWTIVTAVILVFLGVMSLRMWFVVKPVASPVAVEDVKSRPEKVRVFAKQFEWRFWYAGRDSKFYTQDDVYTVSMLTVPVGTKISLEMRSQDVIHSLFLPHLRFKQDVVPGITVYGWFEATKTTELDPDLEDITDAKQPYLDIACAELCGHSHHLMRAQLRILEEPKYHEWLDKQNARLQEQELLEVKDGKVVYYENEWYDDDEQSRWDSSDRTQVTQEDLDLLKAGHKHGEEEDE